MFCIYASPHLCVFAFQYLACAPHRHELNRVSTNVSRDTLGPISARICDAKLLMNCRAIATVGNLTLRKHDNSWFILN